MRRQTMQEKVKTNITMTKFTLKDIGPLLLRHRTTPKIPQSYDKVAELQIRSRK